MNAPWRSAIDRALDFHREQAESRYVQLATIRADGRPANRTLVFRGFRAGTDQLRFTTDLRSAKAEQIVRAPWAEACWYFPQSREQFRLLGILTLVGHSGSDAGLAGERVEVWRALPETSRKGFAGPAPGSVFTADAEAAQEPADPQTPPATFALLLLEVAAVDHLELSATPHRRRFHHRHDGMWSSGAIHP